MGEPAQLLMARIVRQGPVPWSELMQAALYGPGGFYTSGRGAGRTRDFLTSPELGPLFGAVVARAIDDAWDRCGQPDPWIVAEGGAGAGSLAAAVVGAAPRCASALRYLMVETSDPLREAAASRLQLEDAAQVLGPTIAPDHGEDDLPAVRGRGIGPLATSLADLPAEPFVGMVLANELLDNLAFDVYERTVEGWSEVRIGLSPSGTGLVEVNVQADPLVASQLALLAPTGPLGGRVPWQVAARTWVDRALTLVERGSVVVVDYARTSAELAAVGQGSWLRTYRGGGPGGSALARLGELDITADVAIDQLPSGSLATSTQGEWLDRHGLGVLEREAAGAWARGAAKGDLPALRARARVAEAQTLRDPAGLGGFLVLEWTVGIPKS
ncbi:MAG: hypothetical protein NVSMB4_08930 [Acidimicrobiales bacterium]